MIVSYICVFVLNVVSFVNMKWYAQVAFNVQIAKITVRTV